MCLGVISQQPPIIFAPSLTNFSAKLLNFLGVRSSLDPNSDFGLLLSGFQPKGINSNALNLNPHGISIPFK